MTEADPAAVLRALAADVEQVGRRLAGVEQVAADAEDKASAAHAGIAKVVEMLESGAERRSFGGDGDEGEQQPPWLIVDDEDQARLDLADLIGWLGKVYLRYHGAELADCWLWHPGAVAELIACRNAWAAAYYGERATPSAVMDWHDRWRPGTAARVGAELADCHLDRHGSDGDRLYRPARVPAVDMSGELAIWWATTHGSTAAPPPTAAMLAEARARLSAREDAW